MERPGTSILLGKKVQEGPSNLDQPEEFGIQSKLEQLVERDTDDTAY